jgi:hypothetical protein
VCLQGPKTITVARWIWGVDELVDQKTIPLGVHRDDEAVRSYGDTCYDKRTARGIGSFEMLYIEGYCAKFSGDASPPKRLKYHRAIRERPTRQPLRQQQKPSPAEAELSIGTTSNGCQQGRRQGTARGARRQFFDIPR